MRRPGFNTHKLYKVNIAHKLYNIFTNYNKNILFTLNIL